MFAVTAARSFIATQPSIEVRSTEPILLRGASALPLSDTQCMFTQTPEEIPEEQVCFGNNLPTRIELSPAAPLNIGFLPRATSQIEYRLLPALVTDPFFSGTGVLPELNPAFSIATEIQQSAERQREIIKAARQRQQTFSSPFSSPFSPRFSPRFSPHFSPHSYDNSYYRSHDKGYDKRLDGQGEQGIEANGQDFEWWLLGEPEPDMDDSDMATVRYDDIILIEPGSRYWFCSNVNDESQTHNQAVTDGETGSEDHPSSDEDSENEPEDEANPDSGVETTHTYTDPLPVSKELDASAFMLEKLKIKCDSGDGVPAMLEKLKIKCDSGDDKPDPEKMVVKVEAGRTVCQSFDLPPVKKKIQKIQRIPDLSKYPRHGLVPRVCNMGVVGRDGQMSRCGKICRNTKALADHQRRCHTGQRMYY